MVPPSPTIDDLKQLLIAYLHARHNGRLGIVYPSYHLDLYATVVIVCVVPSPSEVHERVARLAGITVAYEDVLRPTTAVLRPRHHLDGVVALISAPDSTWVGWGGQEGKGGREGGASMIAKQPDYCDRVLVHTKEGTHSS